MILFKKRAPLNAYLLNQQQSRSIGFVPTMGALHEGHLSLLQGAARQTDLVVCSIFVNPAQFNDRQDYEKYPVNNDTDIRLLLETQTDVLFLPSVDEIYPGGVEKQPVYNFGHLATILEGASRPRHFQGVGQVLHQLLEIIHPDVLFMGQKDFQQLMIINRLVDLLNLKVKVEVCPVLRETDGLAMSSRNIRLSEEGRKKAPIIYQTLLFIKEHWNQIPFPALLQKAADRLTKAGLQVDYITIANARDLQPLRKPQNSPMICLVAAWLDGVRLIDNMWLN